MKIKFDKSFDKDLDKINDQKLLEKLKSTFTEIKSADNLIDISNIKKMKGYRDFYRIRIRDYRLGVQINDDAVILITFDHRKDIYKRFP